MSQALAWLDSCTARRGRWRSHATTGQRAWPTLSYPLRQAGRDRDDELLAELLRRPLQLELWPTAYGVPGAQAPQ